LRPRDSEVLSEGAIGHLHEATGRPVLTAAAHGQDALEGYDGHGVSTYAVLDALRKGNADNNGNIELSELVAHVQLLVPKLAAEIGGVGGTLSGVKGVTTINRGTPAPTDQQAARYGSRGEAFALVGRLK
jgi:hypothetical protein